MYQIKLNKNDKSITLKKIERSVKLVQKISKIELRQTGRHGATGPIGPQGPQGPQGTPGSDAQDKNFLYDFTNANQVTVNHSLSKFPAVTIMDSSGDEIEGEVEHVSINQLIARFSASFTGRISCN